MQLDKPDMMTAKQAAEYLGIKVQTMALWRCKKMYDLAYIRVGGKIFYQKSVIDEWVKSRSSNG